MRTLILPLLAALLIPCSSPAAEVHRPGFSDVLASLGGASLPAAWAGVWAFDDDDYDCTTNALLSSDASVDTLCADGQIFEDPGTPDWSCSGTADDTSIDYTCSGSMEIDKGCTVTFAYTLEATRSGDSILATFTSSQTFTPTGCAFLPDNCVRTESVGTRTGPPPPTCTTAVQPDTWGRIKSGYR